MPSLVAMERAPSFPSPMDAMTRSSLSVSNPHAMTSVHACFARPRPCASDLNAQSSSKSVPSSAGDRTSPATPTLAPPSTITNKWWGCSSSGNGRVPTNSHPSPCCSRELSSSSSDWLSGRSSTALTAVWPARDAPPPVGHRRVGIHRGTGLRVQDRKAGAPLEIRDQCRPELRVAWQRDLIGGFQQESYPLGALGLREMAGEVTGGHMGMAARFFRGQPGPAQDLRDPMRPAARMLVAHVSGDAGENGVLAELS